ncbi:bifunctional 5,10-methylenetetrahydrofolate dehydrogenase/5,10-methenyltetrahydrofolate cyclohydrolase [Candidatus Curtissbacteria bacterium]|nr:bifunctional 5,10-methylenetetrahydrofolate dehydrogenase/5,10-methenyltetrahydrofolate cyclohydrolase [Candidatus Curtissbacteria bacterium]
MSAKILDGKKLNEKIANELAAKIRGLTPKPKLVIIQVGNLAESNAYIARKKSFGEKIGAIVDHIKLPQDVVKQALLSEIRNLNSDSSVHGVIVQMPLPKHLDRDKIIEAIDPKKDVDGLTSTNLKLLWEGRSQGYVPATTKGILSLLDYYKIPVTGQKVVVVGRSFLVGKPTALAFLNRDATVTVAHSKTKNLKLETRNADILVVAAGKPDLITKEYVSKGQVVVDVGITAIDQLPATKNQKLEMELVKKKLVGDVDFESVRNIVEAISPVPGGTGPMTVASLFENLFEAYNR